MQKSGGPDALYEAIGQRIRDLRVGKRIIQADVADAAGLTRQSVANIEHGRQRFMVHTLLDIARALGVEPMELLPSRPETEVTIDLDKISPAARDFVLSVLHPRRATQS